MSARRITLDPIDDSRFDVHTHHKQTEARRLRLGIGRPNPGVPRSRVSPKSIPPPPPPKETVAEQPPPLVEESKLTLQQIVDAACKAFVVVPAAYFTETNRKRHIAEARQAYCYFAWRYTTKTTAEIAKVFEGGRDHSTILYSYQRVKFRLISGLQFDRVFQTRVWAMYEDLRTNPEITLVASKRAL